MHFFRLTNAFDGRDLIALVQSGEGETRKLAPAVNVHRASTALAMVASFFRAGQMQMFAQTIEKSGARIDSQIVFLAIDTKCDREWRPSIRLKVLVATFPER